MKNSIKAFLNKISNKRSFIGRLYRVTDNSYAYCLTDKVPALYLISKTYEIVSEPYKIDITTYESRTLYYGSNIIETMVDVKSFTTGKIYRVVWDTRDVLPEDTPSSKSCDTIIGKTYIPCDNSGVRDLETGKWKSLIGSTCKVISDIYTDSLWDTENERNLFGYAPRQYINVEVDGKQYRVLFGEGNII